MMLNQEEGKVIQVGEDFPAEITLEEEPESIKTGEDSIAPEIKNV